MRNRRHYYLSFIKHYLSATLIDVLHSPFVFTLYNECIKRNSLQHLPEYISSEPSYFRKRIDDVLLKYILHYGVSEIQVTGQAEQTDFADALHSLNITYHKGLPGKKCDLIYFEKIPDAAKIKNSLDYLHNDSVIVVRNMYDSKGRTASWNAIKELPEITVTVDLFFAGLIFVRREQLKQDFKLRLF